MDTNDDLRSFAGSGQPTGSSTPVPPHQVRNTFASPNPILPLLDRMSYFEKALEDSQQRLCRIERALEQLVSRLVGELGMRF